MKRILKTVSLLLCALFLFSACGRTDGGDNGVNSAPSGGGADAPEASAREVTLPYNPSDSLNPYFAKSDENRLLFSLMYEPLFEPDGSYKPVGVIAESFTVSGNSLTVKIKSGAACRGSSDISAEDVVYSFNLAKASYLYSGELSGVTAASSSGSAVVFTLERPDSFAAGKLNFPVVKAGTADGETAVPTGSGRYYYFEKQLVGVSDSQKVIYLCETDARNGARDALKIGSSDFFFSDLSDGVYAGATGKTEEIRLNNMVFLGLNSNNGALDKYIRSAVAAAVNCEDIALSSYQGHAFPAKLPFNPASYLAKELSAPALKGDSSLAKAILDRGGYTRLVNGVRTNGAYTLSFRLLVNSDSRQRLSAAYIIADTLKDIGVSVRVEAVPFEEYAERIASGGFDMYLGEIKLDGSMDFGEFYRDGSPFSAGIDKAEGAAAEYGRFRAGELSPQEYSAVFTEFYPFIPLCFRTGYIVHSADITPDLSRAPYNIYYNLG